MGMAESLWEKQKNLLRALPNKKQYIEFFTAILSVPIMVTVLVLNINNLKPKEATPPASEAKKEVIIISPSEKQAIIQTPTKACNEDLPVVEITSPQDGERVTNRPVCITPQIEEGDFCSVVWRYNVDNSSWSEYDNKAFCLYDLPQGKTTVRLQVKSIVTGEQREIIREFVYAGPGNTPAPTTPSASSSAQ